MANCGKRAATQLEEEEIARRFLAHVKERGADRLRQQLASELDMPVTTLRKKIARASERMAKRDRDEQAAITVQSWAMQQPLISGTPMAVPVPLTLTLTLAHHGQQPGLGH